MKNVRAFLIKTRSSSMSSMPNQLTDERRHMTKPVTPETPRNLSRHQYGSLKFIAHNNVTLEYLRHAHANTLGSLAERGYLERSGELIVLSQSGKLALDTYSQASLNERGHEGELTERCLRLLKHTRRISKTA